MLFASSRTIALQVTGALFLSACASVPHDTLGFKGVVYSRSSESSSGQTFGVPGVGLVSTGGGTLFIYILVLDDGSKYAVRSFNGNYMVGACLAVFVSAERAKSAGYLNVKETTVSPSAGCLAKVE